MLISVALRKESVDRNAAGDPPLHEPAGSLSARRAWIEMDSQFGIPQPPDVALRKESVDRNCTCTRLCESRPRSLSARRAWIEMCRACGRVCYP